MINFEANYVEAYTLEGSWWEVMWLCIRKGYDFVVGKGSFEGEIRRQLEYLTVVITHPGTRPLAPRMPEASSIPPPTSDEKIETVYFPEYLLNPRLEENEEYRYATWIVPQLPKVIEMLKEYKEGTNQASISIGDKDSIFLKDPPCLRLLDFKIVKGRLNLSGYFRSWDLFAAFPENLGGLQCLKEYVLSEIQREDIKDGKLIAYSSGAHLYQHWFEVVNQLNVDKIDLHREG